MVVQAADVVEAMRLKPNRLAVLKAGKVIARTAQRIIELSLPGRPASI